VPFLRRRHAWSALAASQFVFSDAR
jgi:hypothetical protein